jgi:hypothetical protein
MLIGSVLNYTLFSNKNGLTVLSSQGLGLFSKPVEFLQTHKKLERDMPNLNVFKSNKLTRVFLIFFGAVAASITCVSPASADETVSVNETTLYRDFQVYSAGGSYEINAVPIGGSPVDPVVHLYRGTSRDGYDFYGATVSGDFLAVDDDGGGGLTAYLSGTLGSGLDNYVIRVSSFAYWASQVREYPSAPYTTATPTESYTLSYTGFSSGTAPAPAPVYVRQTSNLLFEQSLYASDTLSDPDGQLRKTVDQIMNKYGSLIK